MNSEQRHKIELELAEAQGWTYDEVSRIGPNWLAPNGTWHADIPHPFTNHKDAADLEEWATKDGHLVITSYHDAIHTYRFVSKVTVGDHHPIYEATGETIMEAKALAIRAQGMSNG